jgi:hypothetical protein
MYPYVANIFILPVSSARVGNIWENDFFDILRLGHLLAILACEYNKLKSPESIGWQPKTPTYSWSLWITDKAETQWEKQIIDLLWAISKSPQGELGMRLFAG